MAAKIYNETEELKKKGLKRKHKKILSDLKEQRVKKSKASCGDASEKDALSGTTENGDKLGGKEVVCHQSVDLEISATEKMDKRKSKKKSKNREGKSKSSTLHPGVEQVLESSSGENDKETKSLREGLAYLRLWKSNRNEWKFKKARQVFLLKNIYCPYKIAKPDFAILAEYLEGVKGTSKEKTLSEAKDMYEMCETQVRELKEKVEEAEKKMCSSATQNENKQADQDKDADTEGITDLDAKGDDKDDSRRALKVKKLKDEIILKQIKLYRARKILMIL